MKPSPAAVDRATTQAEPPPAGEAQTAETLERIATAALLFGAFIGLFTIIQFATSALVGTDGYYHVRLAHIMRQRGLVPEFVWLPMTVLNPASYYDLHFLYHVYLMLFVPGSAAASPEALILGGKLASILMPSLAFLAIWWLLHRQGVRWAWLWSLGLFAVSDAFLYRMSMPRAQSASLLVLALGLHWLLQRRIWPLAALGFLYVWLYNAFPLLVVVAILDAIAVALVERRLVWKPLAAVAGGTALGLIVNPYFPRNIGALANQILPKIGEATRISVGSEWFPYETWALMEHSGGALAAFALGAVALALQDRRIEWARRPAEDERPGQLAAPHAKLTALLVALFFGALLFKSRRFIEYYPAFALVFAALSTSPVLEEEAEAVRPRWLVPVLLALLLAFPFWRSVGRARDSVGNSAPAEKYAAAATWLRQNSPPGSMVFQTDWDDFTRLFFFNPDAVYTLGLDPNFMALYDPDLYEKFVAITTGQVEQPGEIIATRYGAAYVFSDLAHRDFMRQVEGDPYLREIYRDEYAVIWEVERQP